MPAELTSFVGRTEDIGKVGTLLSDARVVTLTGPGGIGKTRLALQVATRVRRWFRDGTRFIDLAPLTDSGLLAYSLVDALRIDSSVRGGGLEAVTAFLRERNMLLVLDNCEQVASACAELIRVVLQRAPDVRMLVTSRQSLGMTGEPEWPVKPLPVPAPEDPGGDRPMTLAVAAEYPGVMLFAQRAAAASGFLLSEENVSTVAQVCRRLDGLPLALELAAALTRVLSPVQILQRIEDQFGVLVTGDRAVPTRQRSLRATVDWSHELCSDEERLLWARSSVFAGWFGLSAAEEVCGGEDLSAGLVLETVTGLVDKSILMRQERRGVAQYRFLDTLARYGRERLKESGHQPEFARRHRNWFLALATRMEKEWFGPEQVRWAGRMRAMRADLRAALEFSLSTPDESQEGIRILAAMDSCWVASGPVGEGRLWLKRALALDTEPSHARAGALRTLGHLASIQGDQAASAVAQRECESLAERFGDRPLEASSLASQGLIALSTGDLAAAVALGDEALRRLGEVDGADTDEVQAKVQALLLLALAKDQLGDFDQAAEAAEEALGYCVDHGEQWFRSWALIALGFAELGRLDPIAAAGRGREVLRIAQAFRDITGTGLATLLMAGAGVVSGENERGAVLLGITERLGEKATLLRSIAFYDSTRRLFGELARKELGEGPFDAAVARGHGFGIDQAADFALGVAIGEDTSARTGSPGSGKELLSRREWDVARQVFRGLSNKEIAAALGISPRTAEGHVQKILAKLGFHSRTEIATWMAGRSDA
ncbi:LuxR C-terminal-related transcriptional regulator [Streptomyces tanashiensis]|uniref:LuxR C-terminal-related transcriptional regulator n=1 Tax=Streptomyces tanashiensis TaxID=67367 RepID=UPI00167B1571|nr:LuxR C-terminal-related transcriptional regulator [Streptomyces tanashiensis]